jgi:hypothetical protein
VAGVCFAVPSFIGVYIALSRCNFDEVTMRYLKILIPLFLIAGAVALVLALRTPPGVVPVGGSERAQGGVAQSGLDKTGNSKGGSETATSAEGASAKDAATAGQPDKSHTAGNASNKDAAPKPNDPFDYGKTPPVKGDANENVKSVVEAVRSKTNPERLSVMIAPKPFDAEAYKADPKKYLNTVEPGRAFQPLQPGEGVPILKPVSPAFVQIPQNGSAPLRVQTTPNGVATFTSFDLGRFSNQLTSITVQADAQGIAETTFFGAPGTIEDVHIVCASPMTSGTIRFTVNVTKP